MSLKQKHTKTRWWFQPIWKNWVKMGSSSPILGGRNNKKTYLSCHHLENHHLEIYQLTIFSPKIPHRTAPVYSLVQGIANEIRLIWPRRTRKPPQPAGRGCGMARLPVILSCDMNGYLSSFMNLKWLLTIQFSMTGSFCLDIDTQEEGNNDHLFSVAKRPRVLKASGLTSKCSNLGRVQPSTFRIFKPPMVHVTDVIGCGWNKTSPPLKRKLYIPNKLAHKSWRNLPWCCQGAAKNHWRHPSAVYPRQKHDLQHCMCSTNTSDVTYWGEGTHP